MFALCHPHLQAVTLKITPEALNLCFLLAIIALTIALCVPMLTQHGNHETWYYALQGVLDGSVILEVAFRWAYHGTREYWKKWESVMDVVIVLLCLAATVSEHLISTSDIEDAPRPHPHPLTLTLTLTHATITQLLPTTHLMALENVETPPHRQKKQNTEEVTSPPQSVASNEWNPTLMSTSRTSSSCNPSQRSYNT